MFHRRSAVGSWRSCRIAVVVAVATLPLVVSCSDRSTEPSLRASRINARTAVAGSVFVVEPTLMTVPTYDGSGQAVHPDVVEFPSAWRGARYWLTMTPYPKSKQTLENPSILTSADGMHVEVPAGLANPVIKAPKHPKDYNSDPELVFDATTDRLVLFHRLVERKTNTINVSTSGDGIHWTRAAAPFWEHSHNAVSPTVATRPSAAAHMFYVKAGKNGCDTKNTRVVERVAADSTGSVVNTKWRGPYATDLSIPGYQIWHIKARWIPSKSEYWMLISAFPDGANCRTDDLFFARSSDGLHWKAYSEPLLRHEDREWTAAAVYRSSFLYDAATGEMSLWISARGTDGAWHLGYSRVRYVSMLSLLEHGVAVTPMSGIKYPAPPMSAAEQP